MFVMHLVMLIANEVTKSYKNDRHIIAREMK